jgi:gliding motility-associated-like protein
LKRFISILILLVSITCFSQKEASKWLFGEKVGLQFLNLTDPPLVLRGELNTLEGCASIADSNGNLLFYSDGSTVWDKNDDIMPNGTGLLGDESSTQSAIIIPKPLDPDIYYLFTVGSTIVPSGYNYYTIDLSLNGGLGEVVGTNFNLTDGHAGSDWSEKITAVQGGECNTFWVISLVKDLYYSYKVDENGVDPNPVISQVDFLSDTSRGYLKVSPDGSKIVAAHQGNDLETNGCFLYSFDHVTGQVLNNGISLINGIVEQPYGVEFSSQANKLYVSTFQPDNTVYNLYQFNLNSTDILNSKILIHTEDNAFRGALQLGPDLKIYVTIPQEYTVGTNYLDVIHNPELDGIACDFEQDYIFFGSDSFSMQGLPPFIQSFFYTQRINIVNPFEPVSSLNNELSLCEGKSYTLTGPDIPGADYEWSFSFEGVTFPLPTPVPAYELVINDLSTNTEGTFELVVTSNNLDCDIQYLGEANVSYTNPPRINEMATLTNCDFFNDNPTDGFTTFNLHNSIPDISGNPDHAMIYYYLNDLDAENDIYNQNSLPQYYMNTFVNQVLTTKVYEYDAECYSLGKLQLIVTPTALISTPDISSCDSGNGSGIYDLEEKKNDIRTLNFFPNSTEIVFFNTIEDAVDNTNPLTGFHESPSEIIYFYATNNGNCVGSGRFNLILNPLPPINPEDINLNVCEFNFPLILNSSIDYEMEHFYWFDWSEGQTTNEIIINDQQTTTVRVTDKITGCENFKTYHITKTTPPVINHVDVNTNTGTVTIFTPENPNLSYILDNPSGVFQSENVFSDVGPGIHTIYVSNECGISQREIYVLGFPRFFTPNGDGLHDTWKVKGLDTARLSISNIQIFDRYGKLLETLDPGSEWNGFYNGVKLPPSDYWFVISIKDQNEVSTTYKGHFSLVQ